MNSRATFESSHAGRIGAYAAGADGMSRSKSASAPAAVILDPRAKLYLLLLANMLLFFHADARAEALLTALFLTPLFLAGRWRMGLRLTACYAVLLGLGLLSDAGTLDTAARPIQKHALRCRVGLRLWRRRLDTCRRAVFRGASHDDALFHHRRLRVLHHARQRIRVRAASYARARIGGHPLHGGHPVLSDDRAGLPANPRRDGPSRSCLRPTRAAAASGPVAGVRAGSAVDERDDRLA